MSDASNQTYWKGTNGTWANGSYWSNLVPNAGLYATIGIVDQSVPSFNVTLDAGGSYSAERLLLVDHSMRFINDGTLSTGLGITLASGTLVNAGVLSGPVSVQSRGYLYEVGQTIFSLSSSFVLHGGVIRFADYSASSVVVTNAAGQVFEAEGQIAPLYTLAPGNTYAAVSDVTLRNAGTIAVVPGYQTVGGRNGAPGLTLSVQTVDNTGLITVTNANFLAYGVALNNAAGATIAGVGADIYLAQGFTNAGLISETGGTLNLGSRYSAASWTNTGTITATNALVEIGGNETAADLAGISLTGSTVVLLGTLQNAGATIGGASGILTGATIGGGSHYLPEFGTIVGGTVDATAASLDLAAADFSGTTLINGLSIASGEVFLTNGAVVEATAGPALATVTVNGGILGIDAGYGAGATISQPIDLIFGEVQFDGNFTSTTPVTVSGIGTTLFLGGYNDSFVNQSSVVVASGGELFILGNESAASIGSIVNNGGSVVLEGTLLNAGQSFGGAGSSLDGVTLRGGTIIGGTVDTATSGLSIYHGAFSGVTIVGGLSLASGGVTLEGGSVVDAAPGVTATITVGSTFAGLVVTAPADGTIAQPIDIVRGGSALLNGGFALTGAVSVSGTGSVLSIDRYRADAAASWSNLSTISVSDGASLVLGGSITTADFGSIVDQGGTVLFDGILDNAGVTLGAAGGPPALTLAGGTIIGGTVETGGSFNVSNGVLDGVSVLGNVSLGVTVFQTLELEGGSSVTGTIAVGSYATLIELGGPTVALPGNAALDGGILSLADTASGRVLVTNAAGAVFAANGAIADGVSVRQQLLSIVTLDNAGTIEALASTLTFGVALPGLLIAVDTLINTGLIEGISAPLELNSAFLTNAATGTIAGFDTGVTLGQGFVNAGLITVSGGTLVLGNNPTYRNSVPSNYSVNTTGSWTNTGTILVDGAVVSLQGDETVADFGSITLSHASLSLDGTIENSGLTLTPTGAAGILAGATLAGATLAGGTIDFAAFGFTIGAVTIEDAKIAGGLTLNAGAVTLANGAEVLNAAGTGPGTITLGTSIFSRPLLAIDVTQAATIDQPIDLLSGSVVLSGPFTLTGGLSASGSLSTLSLLGGYGGYGAAASSWTNLSSISLGTGATLLLGGLENAAAIGSIDNTGGRIFFTNGTFDNTGQTLGLSDPSLVGLDLAAGTILGGAIDVAASSFAVGSYFVQGSSALDNVAVLGPLDVSGGVSLSLQGTTAIYADTARSGPGAVTIGRYAAVDFAESAAPVLANPVILQGGILSFAAPPPPGVDAGGPVRATIAAGNLVSGNGVLSNPTVPSAQYLINQGSIVAVAGNRAALTIYGTGFVNQGLASAAAGGSLAIDATSATNYATIGGTSASSILIGSATFTNQAGASIGGVGVDLTLGSRTEAAINGYIQITYSRITNLGSIGVTDGTIVLNADESVASLGTYTATGSTIILAGGTFDNSAAVLGSLSGAFHGLIFTGGTIAGGTLDPVGLGITIEGGFGGFNDPDLYNVLVTGPLTIGNNAYLTLSGSTSIDASATNPAPGSIVVDRSAGIVFAESAAPGLTNAVTLLGGALDWQGPDATVAAPTIQTTITAGDLVTGYGRIGVTSNQTIQSLSNLGTILAEPGSYAGSALAIDATYFSNQALVTGAAGANLVIGGASFTNDAGASLGGNGIDLTLGQRSFARNTSGSYVSAYTYITNDGSISATNGTIILNGDESAASLGNFTDTGSTIALSGGTFNNSLASLGTYSSAYHGLIFAGGTIAGGTLDPAGLGITITSPFQFRSGGQPVLDNVLVTGPITVGSYATLTLSGSTAIDVSATASTPGSIVVDAGAGLVFAESAAPVLTNAVTLLGGALDWIGPASYSLGVTQTVQATIAAGDLVTGYGTIGRPTAATVLDLTNLGSIVATASAGGYLGVQAARIINDGLIGAANGTTLSLYAASIANFAAITGTAVSSVLIGGGGFTNEAGATIGGDGIDLQLGGLFHTLVNGTFQSAYTGITNLGSIGVTNGTVVLNGDESQASLGAFTDTGSTIALAGGTFDNSLATLGSLSSGFQGLLFGGGTIAGGTLDPGGLGISITSRAGGTGPDLDNVLVTGSVSIGNSGYLTVSGSTAIDASSAGTAPGSIVVGSFAALVFAQSSAPVLTNAVTLSGGSLDWQSPGAIGYGVSTILATVAAGDLVTGYGNIFAGFSVNIQDLTNQGTILAEPGHYTGLTINGTGLSNQGLVSIADNGVLVVVPSVTNSGDFALGNGTLIFDQAITGSGAILFESLGGNLTFGTLPGTTLPIDGFAVGDTIVLDGFAANTAAVSYVAGTGLELTNGTTVVTLDIQGSFTSADFTVTDPLAFTTIELNQNPPCFVAGTRILTWRGEVAVEALRIGDTVVLANGGGAPVRWIGRRSLDITRHPRPEAVWPVLIQAGALADGVPCRDLLVSPDHAVWLERRLIPAKALRNGVTIRQIARSKITYYHIELDRHGVLLAEAAPCESYLETGNRGAFDNGGASLVLHPDFAQTFREAQGCAIFAETGPVVEVVRARLLARAAIATTDDPALVVSRRPDGVTIESRSEIPGEIEPDPRDRRRLGMKIAALTIGGVSIPLDHPALTTGWHDPEPDGRWTDGRALVPAALIPAGASEVRVAVAATTRYRTRSPLVRPPRGADGPPRNGAAEPGFRPRVFDGRCRDRPHSRADRTIA